MVAAFILRFSSLPPQIPLLYTRPWGEEQLVDFWVIFLLPVLVNGLFFLNDYFYKKFFLGNDLVKKILNFTNIFLTASLTLIFIKIIFLVS
jgi:hypothetical protein